MSCVLGGTLKPLPPESRHTGVKGITTAITPEQAEIINLLIRCSPTYKKIWPSGTLQREDFAQEAWMEAVKAIPRYNPNSGASLKTFLAHRIEGCMIDMLRRWNPGSRAQQQAEDPDACPRHTYIDDWQHDKGHTLNQTLEGQPDLAAQHETTDLVWKTLRGMPEIQQRALILYHIEGHRMVDVAKELGLSESYVCQLMARARNSFQQRWARMTKTTP